MSKIGKINISIPEKVKVALAGNIINIEGPLGKKSINVDLDMFNLDIIRRATGQNSKRSHPARDQMHKRKNKT